MRNAWLIAEKELRHYFSSPVAYALIALFAILIGLIFWLTLAFFVQNSAQGGPMSAPMNMNERIFGPVIANMGVFSLFLIPMIAMRLFAEEKRGSTFELLATSPVNDWEIVLGKWLGATVMYGVLVLYASISFLILFMYGEPDWKPMLVAFLGLLLQGGTLIAMGAFLSSLTNSQITAGAASFALSLLLWILSWVTELRSDAVSKVLGYLSVIGHFEAFAKGVINSMDVIYYVSMIFLFLFLATRSLESIRWRG
jgi:ABC-2 type transport system permease protein